MREIDPSELEELANEFRAERLYKQRLSRNPDCRDPEHIGCELCEETDDDTNDFS